VKKQVVKGLGGPIWTRLKSNFVVNISKSSTLTWSPDKKKAKSKVGAYLGQPGKAIIKQDPDNKVIIWGNLQENIMSVLFRAGINPAIREGNNIHREGGQPPGPGVDQEHHYPQLHRGRLHWPGVRQLPHSGIYGGGYGWREWEKGRKTAGKS
jgi:hypothetical protein